MENETEVVYSFSDSLPGVILSKLQCNALYHLRLAPVAVFLMLQFAEIIAFYLRYLE